jgi:DNA invertase Pin-like site-specific DNA recombinase
MKVYGYARVSTTGQAEDGVSLDAQTAKVKAWCEVNDCEFGGVEVDAGISGKRADNRPALQTVLDKVCREKGVLVVYSLSRLARSTKDTILIAERLEKAGANLVSLSERIDTTSASGKMVFRMLAVLAEFERDLVSERTKGALAHKKAKSERVGQVPFGYSLADDGVTLVPDAREQEVIGIIRQLKSDGYTLREIATELERQGIKTKEGATTWQPTTISRILKRAA